MDISGLEAAAKQFEKHIKDERAERNKRELAEVVHLAVANRAASATTDASRIPSEPKFVTAAKSLLRDASDAARVKIYAFTDEDFDEQRETFEASIKLRITDWRNWSISEHKGNKKRLNSPGDTAEFAIFAEGIVTVSQSNIILEIERAFAADERDKALNVGFFDLSFSDEGWETQLRAKLRVVTGASSRTSPEFG